jgi:hypothetical protein
MAHGQIHIEQETGSFRVTSATVAQVTYAIARLIAVMPSETPETREARTVCRLLGHELPRDCSTV